MKQNFQPQNFYGENVNAIYKQVWCTLIAQLLLTATQKMSQAKKAFSVIVSLIRIHLISMLDVFESLKSTRRAYSKRVKPLPANQLRLELYWRGRFYKIDANGRKSAVKNRKNSDYEFSRLTVLKNVKIATILR